jgi:hypothetical protein
MSASFGTTPGTTPCREVTVASSHLTIGSGDRHVMALHGWFGSARGEGRCPTTWTGRRSPTSSPTCAGHDVMSILLAQGINLTAYCVGGADEDYVTIINKTQGAEAADAAVTIRPAGPRWRGAEMMTLAGGEPGATTAAIARIHRGR